MSQSHLHRIFLVFCNFPIGKVKYQFAILSYRDIRVMGIRFSFKFKCISNILHIYLLLSNINWLLFYLVKNQFSLISLIIRISFLVVHFHSLILFSSGVFFCHLLILTASCMYQFQHPNSPNIRSNNDPFRSTHIHNSSTRFSSRLNFPCVISMGNPFSPESHYVQLGSQPNSSFVWARLKKISPGQMRLGERG